MSHRWQFSLRSTNLVRKIVATFLMVAMMASFGSVMANEVEENGYTYPVIPGSTEWKNFKTLEEKIVACQIPENILSNLSTANLIDVVLDYPLMVNTLAFSDSQKGVESITSYFNGMQELSNRSDAATKLLGKFENYPVPQIADTDESYDAILKLTVLESMLSSETYYEKLNAIQKTELEQNVLSKYGIKIKNQGIYAMSISPYIEKFNPQKSKSISAYAVVTTPRGTSVSVEARGEMDAGAIAYYNNSLGSAYPNATRVRTATNKYNCHSYAWYNQSTTNSYWMNDASAYMSDGSYYSTFDKKVNKGGSL